MKILIVDSTHPLLEEGLREYGHELIFDYSRSSSQISQTLGLYDGLIIRSRFQITADFLQKADKLKFIGRYGAGLENIDVDFAARKGITCIRVPEGNRNAVAEHALGMLLSLFNNLRTADAEVRKGIWKRKENTGIELEGKTVGVIGYGFMGSAFVEKLKSFGVNVLIYDKYKTNFAPSWAKETSLGQIFKEADVLSLHVPLTDETHYMVDAAFIQQFQKPFYLLNTARGSVVNTSDLVNAIKSKDILGACLDVLEYEKTSFENLFSTDQLPRPLQYLIASDKVILSPHIAGWSHQSFEKMAKAMLEKIRALA